MKTLSVNDEHEALINKGRKSEIILYQPDAEVRLEIRLEDETVWLSQNIYKQAELDEISTVRKIRTVRQEGNRSIVRNIDYYNLDAIISIGYRVNTKRGIQFRQWANKVLKDLDNNLFVFSKLNTPAASITVQL